MLIVAQQCGINRTDICQRTGGRGCLYQCHVRQMILARCVEGRVSEKAKSVNCNECCRAADVSDFGNAHGTLTKTVGRLGIMATARTSSIAPDRISLMQSVGQAAFCGK